MGKFDNVAILTDIDKTFLADGAKMVARNVEAIEYFKSEGGLFSLSTGRLHHDLENTVIDVDKLVNAPAIMCNGTYFYDFAEKKSFCETFLDSKIVYDTVQFVHNLGRAGYMRASGRDGILVDSVDDRAYDHLVASRIFSIQRVPYKDWNAEGWYKLCFVDTAEKLIELENILRDKFPNVYEYNRSSPTLLELQMKGVNKSRLIGDFKEYYAKQGRELTVYACGDNENDIEMLKKADVAVCPSNAIEPVKAIASKCLCSNNEGVIADLIYNLQKF